MISEITKYVKSKVKDFEVYYAHVDEINAEVNNNKINLISEGEARSVGVRVVIDGKMGFAYTSNLDKFKECVENAIKIAKLNDKDPFFKNFALPKSYEDLHILNKDTQKIDADYIHDFNEEFLNNVHSVNKDMIVSGASFVRGISTMHVVNSEGVEFEEKDASNVFQYGLTLKKDGNLESLEMDKASRDPLKAEGIGKEGAERLMSILGRKQAPSSFSQLLLHPEAFADLLAESYSFAISADNVQQRKSIFAGKLGKPVFDDKITITDDGLSPGLFCTRSCDVEGNPSKKFLTVEKGVLKSFLYDEYTANKDNLESTGNAYRSSNTQPRIGTNNVIMKEGCVKDMLGEMKNGIYAKGLLGVHTMNEATGDFSLSLLEGHYVENGEIKFPVKDTMVAGNFFELMRNVEALGKTAKPAIKRQTFAGNGGYYIPEVLFPKVRVIGKD
jgi:PmbA protein